MKLRAILRLLLGCFALSPFLARADLILMTGAQGGGNPIVGVEKGRLYWDDAGSKIIGSADTVWRLEGDLRENARFVCWSPTYSIRKIDGSDSQLAELERPFAGAISLLHRADSDQASSSLLEDWPRGIPERAIAVFAWVVNGKVVQTWPTSLPSTERKTDFNLSHEFRLTAEEATGQGVILVWANGTFVPVAPRFENAKAQEAFVAMLLGDDGSLRAALRAGLKATVTDRSKISLVRHAAQAGAATSVATLIEAGADAEENLDFNPPPLAVAASNGRAAVVEKLLAAKVDSDPRGWGGVNLPLLLAIQSRFSNVALQLLAAKSDLRSQAETSRIPIGLAVD